jgi:MFS family permease
LRPTIPQTRTPTSNAWIGPFAVLLVCYFLNFALFHLAYPFIPLFLVELGESQSSAIAWTGLGQAVGSLGLMLANPVWGALGDRFGRKAMVLRAMGAGAVTLSIMGLSTNAWHLFVARVLQGLAGGSSPALLTLTALSLPRARLGMAMGLMQTAQFLGNSLGPLMGTLAVGLVGFRGTFFMAAAVMIGLVGLTLVAVRDSPPTPPPADAGSRVGFVQRLAVVGRIPRLRGIVLATLAFQVSYIVSMTLLPLHLYDVAGGVDAPRSVGTVLAASALGGALGSAVLGSLTSRLGSQTIAVAAFLLSGALLVPQVWLSSTVEFAVFRFLTDFFGGAVLPALRTLLAEEAARHESTASSMGTIYGVSQSATAGGNALGAVLATAIASAAGIPATFVAAGLVAMATGAAAHLALRARPSSKGLA